MARTTIRAGDHGAGQAAKICNNMVLGISMIGVCEAFALAEKLGLDAERFFEIASQVLRPVLEPDQLLPLAGPGARRAVEPRLRGRVRHGHDAEGPEARRRKPPPRPARRRPMGAQAEGLYALFDRLGGGRKGLLRHPQLLRGRLDR